MELIETYSHLNGLEYLLVHKEELWEEICKVIASIDAELCKTKRSKEKRMSGKLLYSPIDLNRQFKKMLTDKNWKESRVSYWVTTDERLIRKTLSLDASRQKTEIEQVGLLQFPVIIRPIL